MQKQFAICISWLLRHAPRLFYDTKNRRILRNLTLRNPVFLWVKHGFRYFTVETAYFGALRVSFFNEQMKVDQSNHTLHILGKGNMVSGCWSLRLMIHIVQCMCKLFDDSSVRGGLRKHGFLAIFRRISSETRFVRNQPYGHALMITSYWRKTQDRAKVRGEEAW